MSETSLAAALAERPFDELLAEIRAMRWRFADPCKWGGAAVAELELGTRATNVLERLGIETVADLRRHTRQQLLGMPGVGRSVLAEIEHALDLRGLSLSGDPEASSLPERLRPLGALLDSYARGASMAELADRFGLSRQRVGALIRAAGIRPRTAEETAALRRQEQLRGADREHLGQLHEEGRSRAEIARALGVTERVVDQLLRGRPRAPRRAPPSGSRGRYADEQLLDRLREAADASPSPLPRAAYSERRARDRGERWPAPETVAVRFGSWSAALEAAGLPSKRIDRRPRFTDDDCAAAIREARDAIGSAPRQAAYASYARQHRGRLPSDATIARRYGGWWRALEWAGV